MKAYCNLPFNRIKIDADGKFQSCCHQTTYYGNILTDDITMEELFKLPELVDVKSAVLSNSLHKSCSNTKCPKYYIDLKNKQDTVSLSKYPKELEINLPSTWCNIGGMKPTPDTACIMCPRSSKKHMNSQPSDRTTEILDKIKPAMPYINTFTVLGISEPFWKGKLFEVFDYLEWNKLDKKPYFWTYSNGTIFNSDIQDIYMNDYVNWGAIGFSIDAATQETYKKIRRLNTFDKITKNLEIYFNKTHKDSEKRDWSFITNNINMLNVYEMEDMVRYSKNVGSNRIQFTLTYIVNADMRLDRNLLCNESNWKIFWENAQRAEQVAKELNHEIGFYVPFHKGFLK